ncbi:TPA: PLxRFG domain-containing protein [Stenotrophomonas maltophilia]|uniref:PLxRFG domain-containing protein n=1 Tax=Stenotrophomonas maltophilia TaxID=40324 RepID=UPI0013D90A09|nr:PLxRFG domain-containing protein [Stenotrophomonas maltophilia]MBN5120375.1 PLxRFG domain-containing protein [Stenotrophomonas maltophilia]MBO3002044.1 PLxRFG domain-containing protein [Stenotrophomonas maltophilia]MBP1382075.1 PLxRFG domain-containing protein [Stenotrophomonas maltophilia]MBP1387090.1 PLxRFG domain-containing protein [Stenotrophomonas maltophilia]HEL4105710.1 PLxRFG domain-containing protein [Stenotrophomonas maltophilia]
MATFEKVDGNRFGAAPAASQAPSAGDKVARRPTLSPVQGDPFQKVAKRPERTWGEAIKDTGLGIATGAANIVGGAIEQRNSLEPTNLVRQGLRGLDRLGVKGASETAALVPGTPSEILGGRRAGSDSAGLSKATQMATDYLGESQSEALKQEKQELQDTKGFFASAGKVLSSPRLIGNFLAEQVPNIATMGAGTRAAAAQAGERAMAGALAKGLGTEAAETAATAAGHRAATAAATGMTTVMETGSAGQQTYQQAMAQPQSVWDANPEYKRMVAAGGDPQTVKETIARGASMEAQAITAPIAAIAGRIAAPFEADVFTRGLARKPKAMLAGAARETVEEGLQEGGSQLAGNLGQRQVDPAQAAWEGVPEAAGTGAAIGGLLGGGMAAGGAIASRGDNQAAVAADAERERLARRPVPTPPSLPPPPIPQMLALPPPEVMTAAPDGTITPGGVRPEVMAEPEMRFPQGRGMSAPFDGRRVAARPQPSVPFPDAAPDSIADIANLVSQARRPNEPTTIASAAAAIAEPEPAQVQVGQAGLATPEVPAAAAPPLAPAVAPPWVDAQTGEALREPTPTHIKQLLHNGLQYQVETHGGINTPTLLRSMRDQYGLPSARVRPLLEEVKGERRRGLTQPPADAGTPAGAEAASTAPLPQRNAAPQADLQLDGPATTDRSAPAALASELQLASGQMAAQSDTGSSREPVAEPRAVGATDATTLAETAPERPITEPAPGQDTASAPSEAPKVATAAAEAATNPQNDLPAPTDAQKEAGNYKKGHVRINGHDISIENPAGSQRDPRWPALKNHYGYFKGTVGKDKDHVDVFMTDRAEDAALPVYVVDQVNKDGSFDEHKVIMGTASEQEARDTYLANYSKGWTGLGGIKEMSQEQFKAWLRDPKKTTRRVSRAKPAEAAPALQPATNVGDSGQGVSATAETVGALAETGSASAKDGGEPATAAAPANPSGPVEAGPVYTPKVRIKAGSPEYDRGDIGTLGAYFKPGRIVNAYGNTRDRVIEFRPPGKDPRWQVKVQMVDKEGNALPGEAPRWHSTVPSPRDLDSVLGRPERKSRRDAKAAKVAKAAEAKKDDKAKPASNPETSKPAPSDTDRESGSSPVAESSAGKSDPLFSRRGWEADFPDVVTAHRLGQLSAHADYAAAKAGDDTAALRVARDVITPEFVQDVRAALPEGSKPLVVAVQSQEAAGNNRIPRMAAEVLAQRLGLQVSEDIVQAAKVNRSAGDALHRLANQPPFTGKVEKGRDYVLIDDTLTQGGTLAQLKTHIEDNGGKVVLATALTGKDYSRKIALNSQSLADVRERFGSIEPWWRDQFGYGFEGLTESEARTILTLDKGRLDADALRDRVAEGRVSGLRPVGEGAAGEGSRAEAPGPGGRVNRSAAPAASGGLDFDRALQLKTDLTQHWGENAPSVVVVRSAEDFPASAKVDPGYRRAEGVYDGRPTVWINAGNIATEQRFAQVLAHEAIGHYGVESVVGAKDWAQIVDAIDQLAANGSGSAALKSVLADVTRRYGTVDRETFAKEAIAVMAERGIRNSFTSRVAAAVHRFLRRVMPSLKWSETEVRDLLSQADGFLRAGMSAQAQREMVRSYSFAQPQIDGRGEAFLEQNGGRFLRRDDQWYLADERGRPADFLTLGTARAEAERTGGQVLADPVESGARTWSVVLPNGAEVTRAARGRLFSMPPADALADIDAIQQGIQGEGVLGRARQMLEDLTPSKVKDALRSAWLGALATRHLTELGRDYFPTIDRYSDYLAEMQADRNKLQAEADKIAEAARQWASKNKAESRRLFDLMHQATMDGVDPSREYQPLQFKAPGGQGLQEVNRKNVQHAINVIQQQMRERSGDTKTNMMNEVKTLKAMLKVEPRRRRQYVPLVEQWSKLSPEAKSFYLQFRDAYRSRSDAVEEALIQRIEDLKGGDLVGGQVISDSSRRMLVNKIREQFESARLQGVYFPLQRFGKFFVAAEKDGTNTFLMFESQNELDRAVKDLQAREWAITARGMKMEGKAADAPSGTFVADVIDQLRTAHVSDAVQDQVYQLYLQTMPELSMRKHQIHRKSVPGFDPDAVRAFAYNMQHGSHQLARLRYAHKLQGVLTDLKDAQKKIQASPSVDTRKIVAGDALLEELGKRHDWIMNPTDSALTNLISSFGFTYYLGATPAAALVNVTQTALVSYPYLAARHGGVKAMNYLLAASRDAVRTVGNIQKTLTDPDELRAYQALEVAGAIEKTQAHNLAGIAEGGMTGYNPAWSKAMEIIGWGFHKTEVINREATGMAAYRLARADGKSFDEAVKFARDAIFDTHFDYSNANRARFMQSGTAKVLLMFRQYSLNMTWALGRMVWQATKGQDPQVRQIARRNLTGLLGMSALFSGAMGLPMMGMIMGALNGIQATFGDDDEPWDAETELRAFLTGMLGQGGADLLLHGPADKLTGANISGRVGLDSLWIRDADRELDGRGMFNNLLEQAAGPMGGVLKNVLVGKQQVDEGHIMRGIETMLPKGLKDVIKAGRYATQGVNTLRGDPVVADLSPWEILLQANGFAPEKVSRQYETTRALKNYEQHILDRRKSLVNAFAMALRNGDAGDRASVLAKIRDFNRVNPELAITSSGLQQSIKNRARYSARAEAGIVLNPKLAARLNKAVTE